MFVEQPMALPRFVNNDNALATKSLSTPGASASASAVQCSALYIITYISLVQCSVLHAMQCNAVHSNAVQCSTFQCSVCNVAVFLNIVIQWVTLAVNTLQTHNYITTVYSHKKTTVHFELTLHIEPYQAYKYLQIIVLLIQKEKQIQVFIQSILRHPNLFGYLLGPIL